MRKATVRTSAANGATGPENRSGKEGTSIKQIAALPYQRDADGTVRIMLITSRETRRWVVPKGNPIRGLDAHSAAAREAYEEAGLTGVACPTPLGLYRYTKKRRDGSVRTAEVQLFPLEVTAQASDWPEHAERETRWFSLAEAAAAVDEAGLKALIANFREPVERAGALARAIAWLRRRIAQP